MIRYNYQCLESAKAELGDDFSWYTTTTSSETNSEGEDVNDNEIGDEWSAID